MQNTIKSNALRLAGLSAVTAGVFIKETILGGFIVQSLFSPLGFIVAIAALEIL